MPTTLRPYADNREAVAVEARAVDEALSALAARYAPIRRHVLAENGQPRSCVSVYVNDEEIRHLDGPRTQIRDGDTLRIVPILAGG